MLDSLGSWLARKAEAKAAITAGSPMRTRGMYTVAGNYQRLFSKTPNIQIIHAGTDAVCLRNPIRIWAWNFCGPTITTGPHSPDEQVHISVGHYWTLLTELLKAIPAK